MKAGYVITGLAIVRTELHAQEASRFQLILFFFEWSKHNFLFDVLDKE